MKALKIIGNICTALLFTMALTAASYMLPYAISLKGYDILWLAIPIFILELTTLILVDLRKEEEKKSIIYQAKVKRPGTIDVVLDDGAIMPTRAHEADAGYDLYLPEDVTVHRHALSVVIDTGVHMAIPKGYVGMLKSKSGLNVKNGITGEGVIDSGYTGSIVAKLYFNEHHDTIQWERGKKIIQIVIMPIITPELNLVECLDETDRGDGGFGSTGEK